MTLIRSVFLAALVAVGLQGQFQALSSSANGSALYFVSNLRLKGSAQPYNGKVFKLLPDGVRLVRAQEPQRVEPGAPFCTVGGFRDYVDAKTSSDAVAFVYYENAAACSYPPNPARTQIVATGGEIDLPGVVRLSPHGRHAEYSRFVADLQSVRGLLCANPNRHHPDHRPVDQN